MATIAPPLLQRRQEPDDQQLLKLFWNRAELKKELAKLRRENDRLIDQLRQQENASLRTQQRLEQLENLLADPLEAANAVVYYQLRGVWQQSRRRMVRFARELSERQQDREEQVLHQQFEQGRGAALAAIDSRIAETERRLRLVRTDLDAVELRLGQLRGFWNTFRRRALGDQRAAIQAALDGLEQQVARIQEERSLQAAESGAPFPGLSIEARRNINLAVIALAQQLLIHFSEGDVASLAREAAARSLADSSYGDAERCQTLARNIEAVASRVDAPDRMGTLIQRRAELLRQSARYRRESDTIPVAGSFATVPVVLPEPGQPQRMDARVLEVNVLVEEYWDIYGVLLG